MEHYGCSWKLIYICSKCSCLIPGSWKAVSAVARGASARWPRSCCSRPQRSNATGTESGWRQEPSAGSYVSGAAAAAPSAQTPSPEFPPAAQRRKCHRLHRRKPWSSLSRWRAHCHRSQLCIMWSLPTTARARSWQSSHCNLSPPCRPRRKKRWGQENQYKVWWSTLGTVSNISYNLSIWINSWAETLPILLTILLTVSLSVGVHHCSEQLPGSAPPVHPHHPQDLEEAQATQGGGSVHSSTQSGQHNQGGTEG